MARTVEPHPQAWARLRVDVNCTLRRGAWYRVVRLTREKVVLDVTDEQVPVLRRLLNTVFAQPSRWTVVPRPSDAINLPSDWGTRYAVCPACQGRAPISGFSLELACPHCRGVFAVAWDERYLKRR